MNTLKQKLIENGGLGKLQKAMRFIGEESRIADNGEFCTKLDAEYLHTGNSLLVEFYEILTDMMKG